MVRPSRRGRNRALLTNEASTGVELGDDIDWPTSPYSPTPPALDDLSDVDAPTPSDGDVLTWDTGGSEWVPAPVIATVAELDDVGDVNAPTPSDGDVLTWDSTPGEWVAAAPSAGSGDVATDTIWDAKGDLAGGTGADTAARLPIGTNGQVLTADSGETTGMKWATPSGGGVSWSQDVNQTGTSFASWTSVGGGTWSSNGTEIIQTNTSAVVRSAIYSTMLAMGFSYILECEAQVSASGGRAGIGLSDTAANSNSLIAYIQQGTGVVVEHKGSTVIRTFTTTINTSTWYKLRLVNGSGWISVYLGGTLLGSVRTSPYSWDTDMDYPALYSYNASTMFRNIKAWTLSGSAPA